MRVYDAFISYSHAKDKPVAQAFQAVAQDIGRAWWQRRALRIFRDDSSLAAAPELWPEIQSALDASKYLVLFASPEAAASIWVNKEVAHWLAHKSARTLLIALTDGDLAWSESRNDFLVGPAPVLPPALSKVFASEPKWVDLRAYRAGGEAANKRNPDFLMRTADLAAAIHGMPKEDLLSDELRQQRRALATAWTAAACLALLAGIAAWQAYVAIQERARVERVLTEGAKSANTLVGDLAERFRGQKNIPQKFILDVLGQGRTLVTDLAKAGGERPDLIQLQGKALAEISKTLRSQGDPVAAQNDATHAIAAFEKLASIRPNVPEWTMGLAASYDRLGDAQFDLGRHGDAEINYRKGLALSESIGAAGGPTNLENIAVGEEKLAEVLQLQNKSAEAVEFLRKSLARREQLLAATPARIDLQRAVNVSHGKLAEILLASGATSDAETHQRARVESAEKLAAGAPDNNDLQRELAQGYRGLATVLTAAGQIGDAQSLRAKDVALIKAIAKSDPERADWQLELVTAMERLGSGQLADGKAAEALASLSLSMETAKALSARNAGQPAVEHAVALAVKKVGDALRADQQPEKALAAYRASLAIRDKLPAFPAVPARWEEDTEKIYQVTSDLLVELNRPQEALEVAEQRARHFDRLDNSHYDRDALRAQALGGVAWYAIFDGAYSRAIEAAKAAEAIRPDKLWIALNKAHALMLAGEKDAALAAYMAHRDQMITPTLPWREAVAADFATLRKGRRESPLMHMVEENLRPTQ